jgi:hypothetical protein
MCHDIRDFVRDLVRMTRRIGDKTTALGYFVEPREVLALANVYVGRRVGDFAGPLLAFAQTAQHFGVVHAAFDEQKRRADMRRHLDHRPALRGMTESRVENYRASLSETLSCFGD